MKQTAQPAIKPLTATLAMSDLLFGAMALKAPTIIPIELGFVKPHKA